MVVCVSRDMKLVILDISGQSVDLNEPRRCETFRGLDAPSSVTRMTPFSCTVSAVAAQELGTLPVFDYDPAV